MQAKEFLVKHRPRALAGRTRRLPCLIFASAALLTYIPAPDANAAAPAPAPKISVTPSTTAPAYACPSGLCYAINEPPVIKTSSGYRLPWASAALQGGGEKGGFDPEDLLAAYNLPKWAGTGETVAVIEGGNDPTAESDLAKYRSRYNMRECTKGNRCFTWLTGTGEEIKGTEGEGGGWSTETSLDLDMVSAVCPKCHIMLVQATEESIAALGTAVNTAVARGAAVVSNSYGTPESYTERCGATRCEQYNPDYTHTGVPIVVSAGDSGYDNSLAGYATPNYPASSSSPNVIAVGGTTLYSEAGLWHATVWYEREVELEGQRRYHSAATGSGCSVKEQEPLWQKEDSQDAGCKTRMDNDVAAVAACATPVSIYSTTTNKGWGLECGTSASAPIVAGIEALASTATKRAGAEVFYKQPSELVDIIAGENLANCGIELGEQAYFCQAGTGYDGPTGNGTPHGVFNVPSAPSVTTGIASGITELEATLSSALNPGSAETKYYWEYGRKAGAYEERTAEAVVAAGTYNMEEIGTLHHLNPGTVYHVRLAASNHYGTSYGEDVTFTTNGGPRAYSSEFRKGGLGKTGEFNYVSGVAVSPKGTIWVTDEGEGLHPPANHLYEFNEKEELMKGLAPGGTGNGELKEPDALAVDAKGEVWVDDGGNKRVEIFNENGEYQKALTGVTGNIVAAKGHVWVGEREYGEGGEFIKEVKGVAGVPGAGAIDSKGDFWALSKSATAVYEYNEEGKELRHFGSWGSSNGQFKEPAAIAVGPEGGIWVTDAGNDRVEEFTENGEYAGQFGTPGEGEGQFSKFSWTLGNGLTVDPKGAIYITDNGWVEKWVIPVAYSSEFRKGGLGKTGEFNYVSGVAVSPKGTIWVTDEGEGLHPPANHLYEFNEKEELMKGLAPGGTGNGELKEPDALAVDAKGEVWVDDGGNKRVEIFNENGEYQKALTGVTGNIVAAKGHVWVGEREYGEGGEFIKEVKGVAGVPGAGAIDSKGDFWALSKSATAVYEYNEEGKELRHFGSWGSSNGQFKEPAAIAVGPEGGIWVTDAGNDRVEEFTENGEYAGQFGTPGEGEGQFSKFSWTLGNGLTVDPKGAIYITDNGWVEKWISQE